MVRPTWWLYQRAGLDPHEIDEQMSIGERLDEMDATLGRLEKKVNILVLESTSNTRLTRVSVGLLVIVVLILAYAAVRVVP